MADEQHDPHSPAAEKPVIAPGYTFGTVTDQIATVVLTAHAGVLVGGFAGGFALAAGFLLAVACCSPRASAFGASPRWLGLRHHELRVVDRYRPRRHADFGHSAAAESDWRNSINRFAEAMTLFAVACAGMFPLLHMGRPWLFYWLFPYPNTMGVQPQFRSPLVWDVFAVSTYATVSLLFWFVGLMPDLATLRDRAHNRWRAASTAFWRWAGAARRGTGALRNGFAAAGRAGDAAGALGAHGGQLRLHHRHRARLAQHVLPALFRGRRHLFRLRHGAGAGHSAALGLRPARSDHRSHLDNSAKVMLATGLDRRLRLHAGDVHGLV
jgi:hypothetical protein